jgi:hypothetical protein
MESALRISAPVDRASCIAKADFPEAVGPRIARIFAKTAMSAPIGDLLQEWQAKSSGRLYRKYRSYNELRESIAWHGL